MGKPPTHGGRAINPRRDGHHSNAYITDGSLSRGIIYHIRQAGTRETLCGHVWRELSFAGPVLVCKTCLRRQAGLDHGGRAHVPDHRRLRRNEIEGHLA